MDARVVCRGVFVGTVGWREESKRAGADGGAGAGAEISMD